MLRWTDEKNTKLYHDQNGDVVKLVRKLVLACLKYNLFRFRHVAGYQNVIAEHLSRLRIWKARYHSSGNTSSIAPRNAASLTHGLIRVSLAPKSCVAHGRSVNMLRRYVTSVWPGIRTFPVSRSNLAAFITHMFSANYVSSTLLSTESSVTIDLRRPIDLQMLSQHMSATKTVMPDKCTHLRMTAMCMLTFHGFWIIVEISVRPNM